MNNITDNQPPKIASIIGLALSIAGVMAPMVGVLYITPIAVMFSGFALYRGDHNKYGIYGGIISIINYIISPMFWANIGAGADLGGVHRLLSWFALIGSAGLIWLMIKAYAKPKIVKTIVQPPKEREKTSTFAGETISAHRPDKLPSLEAAAASTDNSTVSVTDEIARPWSTEKPNPTLAREADSRSVERSTHSSVDGGAQSLDERVGTDSTARSKPNISPVSSPAPFQFHFGHLLAAVILSVSGTAFVFNILLKNSENSDRIKYSSLQDRNISTTLRATDMKPVMQSEGMPSVTTTPIPLMPISGDHRVNICATTEHRNCFMYSNDYKTIVFIYKTGDKYKFNCPSSRIGKLDQPAACPASSGARLVYEGMVVDKISIIPSAGRSAEYQLN